MYAKVRQFFWLFWLTISFSGQLSEEGAEHFNKLLKIDEVHHAPQCDREKRLKAIFNRGLERSDPLVREFETKDESIARKNLSHYPPRVQQLVPMPLQDLLAQMNINGEFEFGSDSDE